MAVSRAQQAFHPVARVQGQEGGLKRFMAERTGRICRELEREAGIRLFRRER